MEGMATAQKSFSISREKHRHLAHYYSEAAFVIIKTQILGGSAIAAYSSSSARSFVGTAFAELGADRNDLCFR